MQVQTEHLNPTRVKLNVSENSASALEAYKQTAISRLSGQVKVPGFRAGKAPANMVEKHLNPSSLQSEFLDQAVNGLYAQAIAQAGLRPVDNPNVSLTKFVPYNLVEFSVEVEIVGEIKLPDYKKIKLPSKKIEVSTKEVGQIIEELRQRTATKKEVKRAAKEGDEVEIDFKGIDAKTKEPIDGAAGEGYPIVIGSKRFIPGFEPKLVGLKTGEDKTFTVTFPEDYNVAALQKKKVEFSVKVRAVRAVTLPKLDDSLAKTAGPFKTLAELKADIKKQLKTEKQQEADRAYENEILSKIAAKTLVAVPPSLIEQEINRLEEEERRNLVYQGQTWPEHLAAEGLTEQQHREKQRPAAEERVKAGLILGEISKQEKIEVTPQELELRLQLYKGQYANDPAMQTELEKPENRSEIFNRLMIEKTLDKLRAYSSAKA